MGKASLFFLVTGPGSSSSHAEQKSVADVRPPQPQAIARQEYERPLNDNIFLVFDSPLSRAW